MQEVLRETRGRCKLNIELKTDGVRYPHIEDAVLDCIARHGASEEIVLTSFHAGTLHRVRKISRDARTGLIIDGWRSTLIHELGELGCDFLSIGYSKLNKDRLAQLKEAGIQTMAWTANDKRSIRKLASLDPKLLICTNFPDRWREALGSEGTSGWRWLIR